MLKASEQLLLRSVSTLKTSVISRLQDVAKLWNACTKDVRVPRAPTREVLSMRAYSAQRQLKRLRRDAATLWQSPGIAPVSTLVIFLATNPT
jgi:hypothetical protein